MYGVIITDPDGGLTPFINRTFPDLTDEDIYNPHWVKAGTGEISSLDFFRNIGYEGDLNDLSKIEKEYLDTLEIDEFFYEAAPVIKKSYRLALLSNDVSEWSEYLREKFKINHFFDVTVISGDVKIKKPDAEIFRHILAKLDQPASECVFVDDRRKNLLSAKSLGMETILFNSRNVEYDGKTVNNFYELINLLKELKGI